MGDYAYRTCDNAEIKVGCCGALYYVTFDQYVNGEVYGGDMVGLSKHVDKLTFRLPLESEKGILPGNFDFDGSYGAEPIPIYFKRRYIDEDNRNYELTEFVKEIKGYCMQKPGKIQMTHIIEKHRDWTEGTGIYAYAPCWHGFIPKDRPASIGYNGFNDNVLGISHLEFSEGKAYAVLCCRACGSIVCGVDADELEKNFDVISRYDKDLANIIDCIRRMDKWVEEG